MWKYKREMAGTNLEAKQNHDISSLCRHISIDQMSKKKNKLLRQRARACDNGTSGHSDKAKDHNVNEGKKRIRGKNLTVDCFTTGHIKERRLRRKE